MRLYQLLLCLFPASWRDEYAAEMRSVFAQRRRDCSGPVARLALWLETLPDLLLAAVAVHADLLAQDLRAALRAFRRAPAFAVTAVVIAGLGIGATTAAFTLLDHTILRPYPFPDQDRLVRLRQNDLKGLDRFWDLSPANFRDWQGAANSFEALGAYRTLSANLTAGQGEPLRLEGAAFTHEVFAALGVRPMAGRLFTATDDRLAAPPTVLLSEGLWRERFAADPRVIGSTLALDGVAHTVVGVMPGGFYFPSREARYWTPMRFAPADFADRENTYLFGLGLLKRGVQLSQAQAELSAIAARLAAAHPKQLTDVGAYAGLLRDEVPRRARVMLKTLLGAALCLLLIACTNLANLLLARGAARRRELTVRAALGAGRGRLVRQLLTESLLLAGAGGALGLALAYSALPLLVRLVPVSLPIAAQPALDGRVLAAALGVTLLTGLGFGILPALRAGSAGQTLATRGAIGTRTERLRSVLVVTEVACSVVLLVGLGLLVRALWSVETRSPGFRAEQLITLRTSLPMPRYETPEAREPFYRAVLDQLRAVPGVTSASYTSFLPVAFGGGIWPVTVDGNREADRRTASLRFVMPDYFHTMGIPLLAGRDVRPSDAQTAEPVALVSKSLAARYWPGQSPLGHQIDIGNQRRRVIGVVGDVTVRGRERISEPQVYCSWLQGAGASPWYAPKDLVVRTRLDLDALAPVLRRIIGAADPEQAIADLRTMEEVLAIETAPRRTQLVVLAAFGAAALLLAAIGIHGLLSFLVSSRLQEFGVRVALGAGARHLLALTAGEALRLAALGAVAGLAAAAFLARLLEFLLAGVEPRDPVSFSLAATLALLAALAGSLGPALRALRLDAASVIRAD